MFPFLLFFYKTYLILDIYILDINNPTLRPPARAAGADPGHLSAQRDGGESDQEQLLPPAPVQHQGSHYGYTHYIDIVCR